MILAFRSGLFALVAAAFSACTTIESYVPTMADFAPKRGKARVKIDLSEQRAYLYRSGDLLTSSRISTGKDGYDTPVGSFRISGKDRDHRSSLYGDYVRHGKMAKANVDVRKDRRPKGATFVGAPMPYFMRFRGSVGMHAGNVPYYPASHGCVRMPPRMARVFFRHVSVGTPVRVQH